MSRTSALLAAMTLAVTVTANADSRMTVVEEGGTSQIAIKGDRVRMDDQDTVTLYDARSRQLTVIDHSSREYYRMDDDTLKRQQQQVSEQMRQMREQMEEQLKNMPEEQREMMREQMEQMMQSQMSGAGDAPADIRIRRGGSDRVAGIDCRQVEVFVNDRPDGTLCVADAESLGISRSEMETLRSMFSTFSTMAGSDDEDVFMRSLDELGGFPIRTTDSAGTVEWAVQSVSNADLEAADFEVPAGYREIEPF